MPDGIAELVATLRGLVDAAEADWRRRHLPPLSRDAPRPDPGALRGAQALEAAGRELDAIGGQLRALPAPDPARLASRHGAEAGIRLAEAEDALRGHVGFLLALLASPADRAALEPEQIRRSVSHLRVLAQQRAELLA